ncbi:MAG TPA: family 78 glycoside hydrolase catalytic domain, partial [Chthoniobacteraceae bacterium]
MNPLLRRVILPVLFLVWSQPEISAQSSAIQPAKLRCEYLEDPLGVDVLQPRLGWTFESGALPQAGRVPEAIARGESQTAYQILAASSAELLGKNEADLWDSGQIKSEQSFHVAYAGKPLRSVQQIFWKVRAWDRSGKPSAWSKPAQWTMGVLSEADWGKAKWISSAEAVALAADREGVKAPGLWLRREFTAREGIRRAVLNVSGLGNYTLSVNGRKGTADLLAPGWTNYKKTVLYQTYDLTSLLNGGKLNVLGLSLGRGMFDITKAPDGRYVKFRQSFGPLQAIAQLQIEYSDGTTERIETDASWRASRSPMTFENMFAGEDYDARIEPNWTDVVVTAGPGGALRGLSCAAPPIRSHDVLSPIKVTTPKPGTKVYDLGQNASVMPRLVARGPAGSSVRIIPSELLDANGLADRGSSTQDGIRPAWWQYTLKGQGSEGWFPEFFYHGSRYFQVELIAAEQGGTLPAVETLEGVVVHSASTPIGQFSSSSELFNRTYALVRWAQRSNMMSVMTDCPHREKLPWLEQTHLNGPSLRYSFEMAPLLAKMVNDMADSQLENGFIPNIAPEYFKAQPKITDPFRNSPEWGSAFLLVPWQQYQFTGDTTLLRRHYDAMKRYVAFLGASAKEHIVSVGLGDWYDLGPKPPWGSQLTPPPLTATAFYYYDHWVLARTAELLGKPEEAAQFDQRATEIRAAFNTRFYKPETGVYATGSQTANAIPLVMGLAEPQWRPRLLDAIVKDVRDRGNSLTSGDVGYRYLLQALADGGRSDVIFDMNHQTEKPGYGMMLKKGATALTEKWDATVGNFGSHNHFMLGQINEWFFRDLVGIQQDPSAPAFRKIVIKPSLVGDLSWAKASYRSIGGEIVSHWTKEAAGLNLNVAIPVGSSALVHVPTANAAEVREGE